MSETRSECHCVFIGIDPGASGGLAYIAGQSGTHTNRYVSPIALSMPSTLRDSWGWFEAFNTFEDRFAVIEKVGGFIKGVSLPGSAMFNFGANFGALRMALVAAEIPYEEVTPQRWQRGLDIAPRKRTESKTQWKNRLKEKAQALFPDVKVTLATADALLIAEYCRRLRTGQLSHVVR